MTGFWIALVMIGGLAAWCVIATLVGLAVAKVIRLRDTQVPSPKDGAAE